MQNNIRSLLFIILLIKCFLNHCNYASNSFSTINNNIGADASHDSIKSAMKLLEIVEETMNISKYHNRQSPFVTISFAQTLDGSIAPVKRTRLSISSECSFQLLHSLRARHDAVLIGINTLILDNPRLNIRNPLPGINIPSIQPRPVVIDSNLSFVSLSIMLLDKPIIFTCYNSTNQDYEEKWLRAKQLVQSIGGDVVKCNNDGEGRCDILDCMEILYKQFNITSVLVEGGAGIIQSVLEKELADQIVLTIRPCLYGGYRSMTRQLAQPLDMVDMNVASVGGDVILYGRFGKYQKHTLLQQQQQQQQHNQCDDQIGMVTDIHTPSNTVGAAITVTDDSQSINSNFCNPRTEVKFVEN